MAIDAHVNSVANSISHGSHEGSHLVEFDIVHKIIFHREQTDRHLCNRQRCVLLLLHEFQSVPDGCIVLNHHDIGIHNVAILQA